MLLNPLDPENPNFQQASLPASFSFGSLIAASKEERELIVGLIIFNLVTFLISSPLEQCLNDSEYAEPLVCLVAWALMTGCVAIYNAAEQTYWQSCFEKKSLPEAINPFVYVFAPYLACAVGVTSIVFAQIETLGPWKLLVQTLVGATIGTGAGLWGGLPQMIKSNDEELKSTRCHLLKVLVAFNVLPFILGILEAAGVDSEKLDSTANNGLFPSSFLAVVVAVISTTQNQIQKPLQTYKALIEAAEEAEAAEAAEAAAHRNT